MGQGLGAGNVEERSTFPVRAVVLADNVAGRIRYGSPEDSP